MWKRGALRPLIAAAVGFGLLCSPAAQADSVRQKSVALGGAVIVKPKYEGSDEFETFGIPLVIPQIDVVEEDPDPTFFKDVRQRINFRGLDDIRIRALGGQRFEAGLVTGYKTERDQSDGDLLRGWGDIDGGLVLGGYTGVNIGAFQFDAAVMDRVTGDDNKGTEFRFGVETTRDLNERTTVVARLGTTVATNEYMQTYFGVTPAQAARSTAGLSTYDPDGGFKDVYLELGATYELTDRWLLKAGTRYGLLLGDAADSPVVETENQWSGVLGVAYRFNLPQ